MRARRGGGAKVSESPKKEARDAIRMLVLWAQSPALSDPNPGETPSLQ
jgi:hypothetical protein